MRRSRLILPLVVLVGAAVPAALWAHTVSSNTTISVTAGVPRELQFKVSPSFITSPTVLESLRAAPPIRRVVFCCFGKESQVLHETALAAALDAGK